MALTKDRRIVLELPERLDFEENYEQTASHFQLLRRCVQSRYQVRSLRFDKIRYISPSAALVLASEVDRWKQRVGRRLQADVGSWDEEIRRLLCEMGYFELLKLPRPSARAPHKNVTFLKFLRGEAGDPDSGDLAKQLRIEIENIVGQGIKKHFLYEGLSEAITNVGQHAYPEAESSYLRKQWWLSASYNRRKRELFVMFYDQGASIPTTLPTNWHSFEAVKVFFGTWTDSQKIKAAMELGRSSTERPERGKGLQNLVEFAKAHDGGRLSIYSRRGLYRMVIKRAEGTSTTELDHDTPIGGTLIEWSVRL